MKKIMKRAAVVYVLIIAFLSGVVILCYQFGVNGSAWATNKANKHIYSEGTVVNAGNIYDRNSEVLAKSENNKRFFAKSSQIRKAVLHIVGDTSGVISTGTHNLYRSSLSGYNFIDGIYYLKKTGTGPDLALNVDANACRVAYEAFGYYNGTVLVCNYKTGELLCSVSKPTYDPNNVPRNLRTSEKDNGVFLDKAVSGVYTPGSIMKIVTAVCAVENIPDLYERSFECNGKYQTGDGGSVICNSTHGKIDFKKAMNESCNCAFAEISIELGAEKLMQTAEVLGFNKSLFAKEIPLVMSRINKGEMDRTELAWTGVGQGKTLVNPCHFIAIMNAIANSGNGYAPDRIKSIGPLGSFVGRLPETMIKMNPETAKKLQKLLRSNVVDKYGEGKFPNLQMCGKTGTAEIEGAKSHSLFVGFSLRGDLPLSVIVIAENAGWGSGVASNVANKVLQYLDKVY